MLRAEKVGFWGREYSISVDGAPVSTFNPSWWKAGGRVHIGGAEFSVGSNGWGGKYAMTDAAGTLVARAERVGRKRWTVEGDGRSYQFQRRSAWTSEQMLMSGDQAVGTIRKISWWSTSAEADLPGLSLPVQLFVVAVVVTMWNQQAAAAASSGGGGG